MVICIGTCSFLFDGETTKSALRRAVSNRHYDVAMNAQARKFPHHAPGVLYTHVGWKGTFLTEFMLHSFPFDW